MTPRWYLEEELRQRRLQSFLGALNGLGGVIGKIGQTGQANAAIQKAMSTVNDPNADLSKWTGGTADFDALQQALRMKQLQASINAKADPTEQARKQVELALKQKELQYYGQPTPKEVYHEGQSTTRQLTGQQFTGQQNEQNRRIQAERLAQKQGQYDQAQAAKANPTDPAKLATQAISLLKLNGIEGPDANDVLASSPDQWAPTPDGRGMFLQGKMLGPDGKSKVISKDLFNQLAAMRQQAVSGAGASPAAPQDPTDPTGVENNVDPYFSN